MNEPIRIEPKERVRHFTSWFFSSGWQLVATLLALYLLWDIADSLEWIGRGLFHIAERIPKG